MKAFRRFLTFAALVLTLLILAMTPAAAQDAEQYIPFVEASPSVEPAAVEQPVEQLVQEAQPTAPLNTVPGIVRNEPGHLSKVNDLDVRLAAGEISDPLAGSTTLIAWDKIALVYHADDAFNSFMQKTYDVAETLAAPVSKEDHLIGNVGGGGNMDVAAGNLLGGSPGAFVDTVAAYEDTGGRLAVYLQTYHTGLGKADDGRLLTADVVEGNSTGSPQTGGEVRVATGDFDGDGYDEFVVAWEGAGASLNLRVFETDDKLNPISKGVIAGETLGGYKSLGVTTGDFNADGIDEIAVAWQGADGKLALKLFRGDAAGNPIALVKITDTSVTPGNISLTAGDFDGNTADEIAVAFNTQLNANLHLYQVSADLRTLTKKGTASSPAGHGGLTAKEELVGRQLGVRAGDFNGDGTEELGLVYGASGQFYCNVSVYSADTAFTLTARGALLSTWLGCYGDLSMAVGDMNRDVIAEIVVSSVYGTALRGNEVQLGIFQVAPDLVAISEKGYIETTELVGSIGSGFGHAAVAVGAYDGKSVRVGPPSYRHMSNTLQLLAVINAPPKHMDVVDGVPVDVNVSDPAQCIPGPCTYADYKTVESQSTTMAVTTNRDWSVSEEVKLKFWKVATSLKATYGESFEKTTTSFASQEFGQDVVADGDDSVVRLEQSLNIWEYPVYADGGILQGHILVVWPDKADPTCASNCTSGITAVIPGENPTSDYLPNHELFNVMSYSPLTPPDIGTTIKSDTKNNLGPNGYHWWVKWSDMQTDETKQSNKLDLETSLELSAWGQSLTTSGNYSQGETTVNKVSFEQSTEVHLYFWGIASMYSYGVRPFVYYAQPDGHLVLDYQVTPLTAEPDTWWEINYKKPDPTFNLPWKDGSMGAAYTDLTKEITFEPRSAQAGTIVAITARVRNYSLSGVNNVPVRFYLGDPDQGGTVIGNATVAILNPMASGVATMNFDTAGQTPGAALNIYAVIDPDGSIAEVHEAYNKAYAILPILRPPSATMPGEPGNLSVVAITLDPAALSLGDTLQISATIHAADRTFTWVAVDFWDGSPSAGGRSIGGRLIPIVAADDETTVNVTWPAVGQVGEHELWVVIRHPNDPDITDNRASASVHVEPARLILPLIGDAASQRR